MGMHCSSAKHTHAYLDDVCLKPFRVDLHGVDAVNVVVGDVLVEGHRPDGFRVHKLLLFLRFLGNQRVPPEVGIIFVAAAVAHHDDGRASFVARGRVVDSHVGVT